jgi:hypothetical protein
MKKIDKDIPLKEIKLLGENDSKDKKEKMAEFYEELMDSFIHGDEFTTSDLQGYLELFVRRVYEAGEIEALNNAIESRKKN